MTGGVEGREVRRLQAGSSGDEDPASRFSPSARCPHLGGPEGGRRGGRRLRRETAEAVCTVHHCSLPGETGGGESILGRTVTAKGPEFKSCLARVRGSKEASELREA